MPFGLDAAAGHQPRARLRIRLTQLDLGDVELHRRRRRDGRRHARRIGRRLGVHGLDHEDRRRHAALIELQPQLLFDHREHRDAVRTRAGQDLERRERHVEIPVALQPGLVLNRGGDVAVRNLAQRLRELLHRHAFAGPVQHRDGRGRLGRRVPLASRAGAGGLLQLVLVFPERQHVAGHRAVVLVDDELETLGEQALQHQPNVGRRRLLRRLGGEVETLALEPRRPADDQVAIGDGIRRGDEVEHRGVPEVVPAAAEHPARHRRLVGGARPGPQADVGGVEFRRALGRLRENGARRDGQRQG